VTTRATDAVDDHVHAWFAGHRIESLTWDTGPVHDWIPGFRVHAVAPGPRTPGRWTWVTTGCWDPVHRGRHGIEFILSTRDFTMRAVELLAIHAYSHARGDADRLDLDHTVNLGEAWLPGSSCDHALISLPYPWGPELEHCEWDGGHARLLWVLPITRAERDFKAIHGVEAPEQRFEAAGLDYTDPTRASVVAAT
jgi:hypothetical protein